MKVAIFGSCVTRDAFAFHPDPALELCEYIARSSMASAFHDKAAIDNWLDCLPRIESDFQRRMVASDLQKTASHTLEKSQADAVVVDLIDERFRVVRKGHSVATWTSEFSRMAIDPTTFDEVLAFDSEVKMAMWRTGAKAFIQAVGSRLLVINRAFWSGTSIDNIEPASQIDVNRANECLQYMYDELYVLARHSTDVAVISYPSDLLVADPGHKWGRSPFHFIPEFYRHAISELMIIESGAVGGVGGE